MLQQLHSRNLGGSPDEGTSEPPRDGACWELRPSPFSEYRQIVSGTLKVSAAPARYLQDLKEIGVGPVGHGRILLEAIAALRVETDAAKPPPADAATTSSAPRV